MFTRFILVICLVTANIDRLVRSYVMDEGKPILRINPEESKEERESSNISEEIVDPEWMNGLRKRIENYVDRYGYRKARTYIQELVEEMENRRNIHLNLKLSQGEPTSGSEPAWLEDVKALIKDRLWSNGKLHLNINNLFPAITEIQKKYNIVIKQVQVHQDGNIYLDYESVTTPRNAGHNGRITSYDEWPHIEAEIPSD